MSEKRFATYYAQALHLWNEKRDGKRKSPKKGSDEYKQVKEIEQKIRAGEIPSKLKPRKPRKKKKIKEEGEIGSIVGPEPLTSEDVTITDTFAEVKESSAGLGGLDKDPGPLPVASRPSAGLPKVEASDVVDNFQVAIARQRTQARSLINKLLAVK